jgi:hypothetical protein
MTFWRHFGKNFEPSVAYIALSMLFCVALIATGKAVFVRWHVANSDDQLQLVLLIGGQMLAWASLMKLGYQLRKVTEDIQRIAALAAMICAVGVTTAVGSELWFLLHH